MAATTGSLSARGPRPPRGTWLTPRQPGAGGDALKLAAAGVVHGPGATSARGPRPSEAILPAPRTPDETPEMTRRHRKRTEPGEMSVHWGLKGAQKPEPGEGYGTKVTKGEGVHQVFQSGLLVGVAEHKNAVREAVYQSTAREPLGKSWVRGHTLPAKISDRDFPGFGKGTVRNENSKLAVQPTDLPADTEEQRALYRKTHGSVEPGEQHCRNYAYPRSVTGNPGFRFGNYGRAEADKHGRGLGAKAALSMETGQEPGSLPSTTIVKASLDAYQKVAHDHLGASRSLKQNAQPLPPGHAYGAKSFRDDVSAGVLIGGFYAAEEQMPDHDLGKCTVPGRRNMPTDRAFGTPSVRRDLAAPPIDKRSVASTANYGDDADAFGLIFPNKTGPVEDAFHARRTRADVEDLITSAGLQLEPAEFDEVFAMALEMQGDGDERTSVDTFKHAYVEWSISSLGDM